MDKESPFISRFSHLSYPRNVFSPSFSLGREPHRNCSQYNSPVDDETNPLFISAVRIFLEFIREKHGIAYPEKCSLDQLIYFLSEFQEEAKTKKGEKYSPSTIRVIRYSLNRVIALGKNHQEMRPYPTQTSGTRKRRRNLEDGFVTGVSMAPAIDEKFIENGRFLQQKMDMTQFAMKLHNKSESPTSDIAKSKFLNVQSGKNASLPSELDMFRFWLVKHGFQPSIENYSAPEFNRHLVTFLRSLHDHNSAECSRIAMEKFRMAIAFFFQRKGIDFERDPAFEPAREAHEILLQNLTVNELPGNPKRKYGQHVASSGSCAGNTEWLGIPVEYIKEFYQTGTLSTNSAVTLQRKVWFELTVFFRSIPCCPDQLFWTKNTFKVTLNDHGMKFIELNPDMYSRFGHSIERQSEEGRILVQRPGSPYCPVKAFELYLSCLEDDVETLFPRPVLSNSTSEGTTQSTGTGRFYYTNEPLPGVVLSNMMQTIALAAHVPINFSNLSAAETEWRAWMRAITAIELEIPYRQELHEGSSSRFLNSPEQEASSTRTSVIHSVSRNRIYSDSPAPESDLESNRCSASPSHSTKIIPKVEDDLSLEPIWTKKKKLLRYTEESLNFWSDGRKSVEDTGTSDSDSVQQKPKNRFTEKYISDEFSKSCNFPGLAALVNSAIGEEKSDVCTVQSNISSAVSSPIIPMGGTGNGAPMIIVRPQIFMINLPGAAPIEKASLRGMIQQSLSNFMISQEMDALVEDAYNRAMTGAVAGTSTSLCNGPKITRGKEKDPKSFCPQSTTDEHSDAEDAIPLLRISEDTLDDVREDVQFAENNHNHQYYSFKRQHSQP